MRIHCRIQSPSCAIGNSKETSILYFQIQIAYFISAGINHGCLHSHHMQKRTIYLCIGGNLGDQAANLEETRMFITFNFGDIVSTSSIYESEAWQMESAPSFLNQVIKIESILTDEELLEEISDLEDFYGRERSKGVYLSREMDIDVLFVDDQIIEKEKLIVPHPRLYLRKFVLVPLNEIAAEYIHPILKKNIALLLKECPDEAIIKKI